MNKLTKKIKWIINIASLIVIITGVSLMFSASRDSEIEGEINNFVSKVELINVSEFQANSSRLSVTGLVESLEQVELKSQVSAKVRRININIGDQVLAGQTLVSFDNDDIYAQLLQAEAGLESAQARLSEIKRGARNEELQIAQTTVISAETTLQNTKDVADASIDNLYSSALTSLQSAASLGRNGILTGSNLQKSYFNGDSQEDLRVQEAKEAAIEIFLGRSNTSKWETKFISELADGIFGIVQNISDPKDFNTIDSTFLEMSSGLAKVKNLLEIIPILDTMSNTEQTSLTTEKSTINGQITTISGIIQGISVQKIVNQSSINGAEAGLEAVQNQLTLVESGASSEQIAVQEAVVKSNRASVLQVQAQLAKTIIRSPISGIIGTMSVRLGELVSPGQIISSVVNNRGLEIKTYVESDEISKMKIGDLVMIEDNINGVVNRIAPSVDSVTKKVEINLVVKSPQESGLVVGQFVNADILMNNQLVDNSKYLIPLQAIKISPDKSVVYVVDENQIIVEKIVSLGKIIGESIEVINGLDTNANIISMVRGLEIGQKVEVK